MRYIYTFFLLAALMALPLEIKADGVLSGNKITSGSKNVGYAFDNNVNTTFTAYDESKAWVGLEFNEPYVITKVGWAKADGKVTLGMFEGANQPDFRDAVPLAIIEDETAQKQMAYKDVNVSRGFKYVRYVGPHRSNAKIAEVQFYGHAGVGDNSQFFQLTNLPTITIHTENNVDPWDKVNEIVSNITIVYDNGKHIQEEYGTTRLRGNTSMGFDKKPYRIKFESKKRIFEGSADQTPAKCKKWVLSNSPDDKTLMRNILGFELSKRMGMAYTPYAKAVDVIYNGEYKGCYQLMDQITIDKARVNIPEMKPEDIEGSALTGGYLLEVDALANQEVSWFTAANNIPVTIKSPDEDDIQPEQRQYIEHLFSEMTNSVFGSYYRDKEKGYKSKLDAESFLRYFILEQFIANSDAFWSTFMYKNRDDDMLYTGPCWDLNLSMDNDSRSYPACNQSSWVFRIGSVNSAGNMRNFVNRILSDPAADKMLHDLWTDMRDVKGINAQNIIEFIDAMEQELQQSVVLDNKRWGYLGQHLFNNPVVYGDYGQEVQVLRTFMENQIPWMDMSLTYGEEYQERETDFTISNADQLIAFAKEVNSGNTLANAVLTADIDMEGKEWIPIGSPGNMFCGTFDGQQHRILNITHETEESYQGFFGVVSGGAMIRNLIIDESCYFQGSQFVGGLIGGSNGGGDVTIENCGNEAIVLATLGWGSANAGGLVGVNMGSGCTFTINNSYNSGKIIGASECGAMSGWIGDNARFTNCYNIGEVEGAEHGRSFTRRGGNARFINCYQLSTLRETDNDIPGIDEYDVSIGELCFMLNANGTSWYQNLDNDEPKDEHPVPFDSHGRVYRLSDGYGYTNTVDPLQKEYYEIASAEDLLLFAQAVSRGNVAAKAVVTANIDMSGKAFMMIGNTDRPYTGEFDGGGFTIDNIEMMDAGMNAVGLFSVLGPEAYVHDVTIGAGCTFEGNAYVAGIAGCTQGAGRVVLERCGNEATVISHDKNAAGLIGCNRHSEASISMIDCYNTGNVYGGRENGALCGWIGSSATLTRCYNTGVTEGQEGTQGLYRGSGNMSELYDLNSDQAILITEDDLKKGRLCYMLDNERGVWSQNVDNGDTPDGHPVLGKHAKVYFYDNIYTNIDPETAGIEICYNGNDAHVVSISYYSLDGQKLEKPTHGVYICKATYSNGVTKIIKMRQ